MDERGYVRTTVLLREDHYQRLKRSNKGLSKALEDDLDTLRSRRLEGFLPTPGITYDDVRDKADRV